METARLEPGTVLAGKYRLESRLGEGGMGTVYRAEHLVLRAPVAVKVIDREVAEGDVALTRFMREAQAAASLRSPHVVQILDYGMDGERPFMVMELLEGETLADRLDHLGRLGPAETYRVISHIARAVAKAHEAGIVHRDLKPDNVFLVHNEGDEIAKVLDFGVAKMDATSLGGTHTRTGSLLGTPYYMSPEQAQGNKEVDSRSDLWALGVIAFECLLGRRPFASDGLGDLVIQICIRDIIVPSAVGPVPERFDVWFAKAVARDPDDRFQTARELSETLRDALGLARDPLGSAPDSMWSLGPSLMAMSKKPEANADPALAPLAAPPGGEAPLPDFLRTRDEGKVGAEVSALPPQRPKMVSETLSDVAAPRPSAWQVIPHGEESDVPLPRRSSTLTAVIWVALGALLLGASGVFLLHEVGVDWPLGEKPAKRPLRVRDVDSADEKKELGKKPGAKVARPTSSLGAVEKGAPEGRGSPRPQGSDPETSGLDAAESEALKQLASSVPPSSGILPPSPPPAPSAVPPAGSAEPEAVIPGHLEPSPAPPDPVNLE